jgi:hypothetical protein
VERYATDTCVVDAGDGDDGAGPGVDDVEIGQGVEVLYIGRIERREDSEDCSAWRTKLRQSSINRSKYVVVAPAKRQRVRVTRGGSHPAAERNGMAMTDNSSAS